MTLIYTLGDSLDVARQFPDRCIDLVVTSSPYERKVQYLDPEDPLAEREIGHEETPAEFLDKLLDLTDEWGRLLVDGGSIALDLGDSFAGSGGAGGDYTEEGKKRGKFKYEGTAAPARRNPGAWPRHKSLCMIPEAYRMSLAYGRNIFNGRPLADRWIVRNTVRLCSENPPTGRQGDKFTPAVTEICVATLDGDRYWNEDHINPSLAAKVKKGETEPGRAMDWWVIRQQGDPSHPAVWPKGVPEALITALCPLSGVVLDPFAGSGRTLDAAGNHGRHAIGIDLNPAYLERAQEVCGMYLETKTPTNTAFWLKENRLKFQGVA